jgi:hypothetical protein
MAMGKDFGRPAMPARKCFFHVHMACLAGFVQWMSWRVYWMQVCSVVTNMSMSFDVSLSSLCRRGLKSRCVSHS